MDVERPTAILTKGQREYLNGDKNPSQERTMRTRIRERLMAGLTDISLIVSEFDTEDIEKAVSDGATSSDLVALAILVDELSPDYGTGTVEYDPEKGHHLAETDEPEATIEFGVRAGYQKLERSLKSVTVDIEEGGPLEEIVEQDLASLSETELVQLRQAGKITRKEMGEALLEKDVQEFEGGE